MNEDLEEEMPLLPGILREWSSVYSADLVP
jgi:hypothetical protein